jgi:hypothetical protein
MIAVFGPMSGSYLGPYPTRMQALAALRQAEEINFGALVADRFVLGGNACTLDAGVGAGILPRSSLWGAAVGEARYALELRTKLGPITGATYNGQCVILRIPTSSQSRSTGSGPSAMIALIDRDSGRPFAYYGEGDYHHPFPPMAWRKNP